MLSLNSFLLSSEKPKVLGEFYQKVFGIKPSWHDGEWTGFDVGDGSIAIGPHDKVHGVAKEPERMMLNLTTDDVEGEFARIKKLGAEVIAEPYTMGDDEDFKIATFADPDGNYFQLMSPTPKPN